MAIYQYQRVLVWDSNPGGTVRLLRNGKVTVKDWLTGDVLEVATADDLGMVNVSTASGIIQYETASGFLSDPIVAPELLTAAATFSVSEDTAVADLVNDPVSSTRGALDTLLDARADSGALAAVESDVATLQTDMATAQSDISGLSTDVAGLDAQVTALQAVAVAQNELILHGVWHAQQSGSTPQVSLPNPFTSTMLVVPINMRVTWLTLVFDFWTFTANASNYWTFALQRNRGGTYTEIARVDTSGGVGIRVPLDFSSATWDTDAAVFQPGDLVILRLYETGTAANVQLPMTWSMKYEPL